MKLLNYRYKYLGIIFVVIGVFYGIFHFYYGIKFAALDLPVFAVYSKYFDTKILTVITNNLTDELVTLSLLAGLTILIFSKEKNESESLIAIRHKSFFLALLINNLILLLAVLFLFGFGFYGMMMFNIIMFDVIYLFIFRILVIRNREVRC